MPLPRPSFRTLVLAAGLAATLCGGLAAPALADPDDWHRREWREHQWRAHEWREREWREYEWRERHPYGAYAYAYPAPGYVYQGPPAYYYPPAPYVAPSFGLSFTFR
jgi:hypothetical protein